MDFLAGLGKAAASGVLSGVIGSIGPSAGRQQRRATIGNLQNIVTGAQRAGFNPLTVLRATGGDATGGTPIVSPLSVGSVASQMVGDYISNYDPILDETRKEQAEFYRAQTERIRNQEAMQGVSGAQTPVQAGSEREPHYDEKIGPVGPPETQDTVQVWYGGEPYFVNARTAERLRLRQGDPLIGEDIEAMMGGLIGEGMNVANARKQIRDILSSGILNDPDLFGLKGALEKILEDQEPPLTSGGSSARKNR